MPSYLYSEIFPAKPRICFPELLFAKFALDQLAHRFHRLDLVHAFSDHLNHGTLRRGEEQDTKDALRVHRPCRREPTGSGRGRISARVHAREHDITAE